MQPLETHKRTEVSTDKIPVVVVTAKTNCVRRYCGTRQCIPYIGAKCHCGSINDSCCKPVQLELFKVFIQ